MTTTIAVCPRCRKPVSPETAATLRPGDVALHAPCYAAACEDGRRLLEAAVRPPRREPTCRVTAVRPDGSRDVQSTALDLRACAAKVRWLESNRPDLGRFVVEPEE